MPRLTSTPGVSRGTRIMLCWRCRSAVRVGLAHHDEDLAVRVHRAGRPPLAAVDDVLVAVALDPGGDVGGVGGGDVRLGHAERRPDLAVQQRFEPAAPSAPSVPNLASTSMLPVSGAAQLSASGARCGLRPVISASGAYCRLVSPRRAGECGRNRFHRPARAGLRLQLLDDRRRGPARSLGDLLLEHVLGRVDVLVHEGEQPVAQLARCVASNVEVHAGCQRILVERRASMVARSGEPCRPAGPRAPMWRSPADGLARRVAVVDALEDHRELVAGERDVPVQLGRGRRPRPCGVPLRRSSSPVGNRVAARPRRSGPARHRASRPSTSAAARGR